MAISKNQVKFLTSLQLKKNRQNYRKFTVEGEKLVGELLRQQRFEIDLIFGTAAWAAANEQIWQPHGSKFSEIEEQDLKKISSLSTPNKVLAVVEMPPAEPDFSKLDSQICLFLDGLQDPSNLGAILRVADWFGIPQVFCSPDSVDVFNQKVIQTGMGAFLRVPAFELDLLEILNGKPALPLLGAVLEGENLFKKQDLPAYGLLVIGNEGRGISPSVLEKLTHRLSIPRHPDGGAESLNAAVACGIFASRLALPSFGH